MWNHAAGPDFTGCAVQHDGGTLRGDIELDGPAIARQLQRVHPARGCANETDLMVVQEILEEIEGLEFVNLGARDVVRHRIVQDIVEAYRAYGEREAERRSELQPQQRHAQ